MYQFENVFPSIQQYGNPKVHFICLIGSFKMLKISCESSGYIQVKSTQRKKKFFLLNNEGRECKKNTVFWTEQWQETHGILI